MEEQEQGEETGPGVERGGGGGEAGARKGREAKRGAGQGTGRGMVTRVRQRKRLNMRRKNLKSLLLKRRLLMEEMGYESGSKGWAKEEKHEAVDMEISNFPLIERKSRSRIFLY